MEISNKFNLGDTVYYPSADLRAARVFKSVVTGIVITNIDDKQEVIYQTGQSYGVSEEDMFINQPTNLYWECQADMKLIYSNVFTVDFAKNLVQLTPLLKQAYLTMLYWNEDRIF